jgi:hypothetical protein
VASPTAFLSKEVVSIFPIEQISDELTTTYLLLHLHGGKKMILESSISTKIWMTLDNELIGGEAPARFNLHHRPPSTPARRSIFFNISAPPQGQTYT